MGLVNEVPLHLIARHELRHELITVFENRKGQGRAIATGGWKDFGRPESPRHMIQRDLLKISSTREISISGL